VTRWLGVVLALLTLGAVGGLGAAHAAAVASTRRRNVLFVLTDDLDTAELRFMPHTRALIGRQGTTFDDYFVSNSLCCPSRATTLRGQYAHNTGVWTNGGANGGFERAYSTGVEQDTIATDCTTRDTPRRSPASTSTATRTAPAPTTYRRDGTTGRARSTAIRTANTTTCSTRTRATTCTGTTGATTGPTSTSVSPTGSSATRSIGANRSSPTCPCTRRISPRHRRSRTSPRFGRAKAPRPPSFDQADVHRMPMYVRDLPPFTPVETTAIDSLYRKRIRSLQAVDRGVARLVHTLKVTGQLDNTYIVFTSDNGFHLGQHRMPAGKQTPYESDIHVPLLVRGPGVRAGAHEARLAGNTDLAPTFEAMAGVRSPAFTDGRSLLPLLHGHPPARWRQSYLIEHRNETGAVRPARPAVGKVSPLEPPDPDEIAPTNGGPPREIRDQMLLGAIPERHDHWFRPRRRLLSRAPQRSGTQCARCTGSISARDRDGIQSERTRACRPDVVQPSRRGQRDQASSSRFRCGKNSCGDRGLSSRALSRGIRSRNSQGTPGNRSDLCGSASLYGRALLRKRACCDADEAPTRVHRNSLGFRGVSEAALLRECPFVATHFGRKRSG